MNNDNYDVSEQRRRKAEQFKLNINVDINSETEKATDVMEESELNSYSGQDVKEQMAKESRHALRKKRREQKKEKKAKNKRNRRAFGFMWLVSVVIVGSMGGAFIVTGMNDLLAVNRTDSSVVNVEIPKNPTMEMVANTLKKNGIIDETSYFTMYAMLTKTDDDFTQGTYEMRKNMDYEAIIDHLLSSGNRTDTVSVMITEGLNVIEIANTLKENGALSNVDDFLELCSSDNFDEDFDFLKDMDNRGERYYKLEGYLYPDTYEFYKNEAPEKIIYKFLNNYEVKINEKQDVSGYSKLTTVKKMIEKSKTKYSIDEIMTIASIIQAEAADTEDMYYVSSIVHNRLTADINMGVSSLGLDSTKYYPYRSYSEVPEQIQDEYVSTYDTYSKVGLPAGPICNPGMEAIKAAINPKSTNYYFFCHDSKGNAYYATTMYEQNANLEYIENND